LHAGVFLSLALLDLELVLFEFKALGLLVGFAGTLLPLLLGLVAFGGVFFAEFADIAAGAEFLRFKSQLLDALAAVL
jgi:hypothetical protein